MSSTKRRQIVKLKKGVQDKLKNIQEQREILNAIIDHYVSEVTTEAESLLSVSDPTQFMQEYMGVMLNLDRCYNGFEIIIAEAENLADKDDTAENMEEDNFSKEDEECSELYKNNATSLKFSPELPSETMAKSIGDNSDEGIASKASSVPSLSGDVQTKSEMCTTETLLPSIDKKGDADVGNVPGGLSVNESDNFVKPFTDKHVINITDEEGLEEKNKPPITDSNIVSSKGDSSVTGSDDTKNVNSRSNTRRSTEKSGWTLKDAQPRVDIDVARRFLTRILNTNEQHNRGTGQKKNQRKKTEADHEAEMCETKTDIHVRETEASMGVSKSDVRDMKADMGETKADVGEVDCDKHNNNEIVERDLLTENIYSVDIEGKDKAEVLDVKVFTENKEIEFNSDEKKEENQPVESKSSTESVNDVASGGKKDTEITNDYGLGPKLKVADLPQRSISVVEVTEPASPWKFYIQICGTNLNKLMEDICHYMIQKLAKNIEKPVEGMSCLAKFSKDDVYYRAKVTNVYSPGKNKTVAVDVVFVDYGNGERRKSTDLRELPEEYSILPAQAICCAVAKVAPANKYGLWTEGDILYFQQFVSNQQFNCIPVFHSDDPEFPHLIDLFLNFPKPAVKGGQVFMQPSFTQISVLHLLENQGCAKKIDVGKQLRLLGMPDENIKSPFRTPTSDDGNSRSKSDEENINYDNSKSKRDAELKDNGANKKKNNVEKVVPRNKKTSPRKENIGQSNASISSGLHRNKEKKEQRKDSKVEASIPREPSSESNLKPSRSNDLTRKSIKNCENSSGSLSLDSSKTSKNCENPRDSLSLDGLNMNQNNLSTTSEMNRNNNENNICEKSNGNGGKNMDDKVQNITACVEYKMTSIVSDDQVSSLSTESETVNLPMDLSFGGQSEELSYLYNQGHKVMLSHIESPDSFYVHVGTESTGRTLDKMMKSLNKTFEQKSKKKLLKLSKSFHPVVNELCCAQFSGDSCFYRAVITEVRLYSPDKSSPSSEQGTSIESYHAFYVDFGNHEWVTKKKLFPLPEEYRNIPPLAIHCSLAYIRPSIRHKDEVDNISPINEWSSEAINAFLSLTDFEKLYDMLIVSGNLNRVRIPDMDGNPLKILLVDNNESEEICINMDLIHAGVAMIDTSNTNQVSESPTSPEVMMDWDPMMEDYLSIRNSYKVDVDDAGVAAVGYKAQDEKRICKYYSNNTCWRGERCPYRHVQTSSDYITLDREAVFGGCIDHQEELLPEAGSWVAMEISTIMSPGHFYIILPWGKKSIDTLSKEKSSDEGQENSRDEHEEKLEDLLHCMSEHYSTKTFSDRDLLHLAPGELVASKFSLDGHWYRAKVLNTDENRVQVFYVDFGNKEWVPETTIRQMEPEFLHLPFQAIECFLLDVEPVGQQWSREARQTFRELVDGKTLVAHVKQRSWNGCLWMELFDTTGPEDISIAKALIERGLAQEPSTHSDVGAVRTRRISIDSETRKTSSASDSSFIFVPG